MSQKSTLESEAQSQIRGAEPDPGRDAARLPVPRRGVGPGPAATRRWPWPGCWATWLTD